MPGRCRIEPGRLAANTAGRIQFKASPVKGVADNRREAAWARLIRKVYEVDALECVNCGATLRIIALIDDAEVIERLLKHLDRGNPHPHTYALTIAGADPSLPRGETVPPACRPLSDIA